MLETNQFIGSQKCLLWCLFYSKSTYIFRDFFVQRQLLLWSATIKVRYIPFFVVTLHVVILKHLGDYRLNTAGMNAEARPKLPNNSCPVSKSYSTKKEITNGHYMGSFVYQTLTNFDQEAKKKERWML